MSYEIPLSVLKEAIRQAMSSASGDANLARDATLQNLLMYLVVENGMRCWDVVVDDVFAIPSGSTWYVKSLYVSSGQLYIDGDVKVV